MRLDFVTPLSDAGRLVIYTREELDWIEAEWAFHLHGRSAFLSREDFDTLQGWSQQDLPAETLVNCMEAYFQRRAKRPRPRAFVALAHLEKDVAKALQLRAALLRAGAEMPQIAGWDGVKEPLRSDPRARAAFDAWARLQATSPNSDAPGFLDHFDRVRQARQTLLNMATEQLEPALKSELSHSLEARLREAHMEPDSFVWNRAWELHWDRMVGELWKLPGGVL